MSPEVTVYRLGHRPSRDKRMTTHVCLTARAFGARRALLDHADKKVEHTVRDVTDRFGGPFDLQVEEAWRKTVKGFAGPSIHLTMYGEAHTEVLPRVREADELLVIVGAEKVPGEIYDLATHNVAVGNQPHSEVAALSTVLYELLGPDPLTAEREGARLRIEPTATGKRVRKTDDDRTED